MKYAAGRPYADPEKAARRILEIANAVEPIQGRIHIEKINEPFLFRDRGSPAEYGAGLKLAIERGWLTMHDRHGRRNGPWMTQGWPLVRLPAAGLHGLPLGRRQRMGAHALYPRVLCCPHGVIRFQHQRKISSILVRDTVAPIAIRTTSGSCSLRDVNTENRSCYEYHPPGPSKTVRTAVGRSIFPAGSFGRTSKPAAGEREPADCRACHIKRKTRRVEAAGLRPSLAAPSAGPKPRGPRVSMTVFLRVIIGQQLAISASTVRQLISGCAELSHSEHPNEYAASF